MPNTLYIKQAFFNKCLSFVIKYFELVAQYVWAESEHVLCILFLLFIFSANTGKKFRISYAVVIVSPKGSVSSFLFLCYILL